MPLLPGRSREVVSDNIRELRSSGRPEKQAIAIALSTARRKPKKPAPEKLVMPKMKPFDKLGNLKVRT